MIYRPQNLTADEILQKAGFTRNHSGSMGWVRPIRLPLAKIVEMNRMRGSSIILSAEDVKNAMRGQARFEDRLHATTHEGGYIKIHLDLVVGDKHEAKSQCPTVRRAIKEFTEIDLSTPIPLTNESIQVGALYTEGTVNDGAQT